MMLKRKIKVSFVSILGPSVAIPKRVDVKLKVYHCLILLHSSCPPHPLSTPNPYSCLALHSSDFPIRQCVSLLWQKSVQDFNAVWQETHSQMGLRSARESTAISVNGRQGSVETWKGGKGHSSWVCFIGLLYLTEWHPKRDKFGEKRWYFWLHQQFAWSNSCSFEPILLEKLVFYHFVQTLSHI